VGHIWKISFTFQWRSVDVALPRGLEPLFSP
jgi:hypothetical protein